MKKIFYFMSLFLTSYTAQAQYSAAGWFIEPGVFYQSGTVTVDYPAPFSESSETIKGYGIGLRVGGHFADILFYAADLRYGKPHYDSDALSDSADAETLDAAATFGVQTPFFGIRAWASYLIDGTLDPGVINSVDIKYSRFGGYRIGVGLYIAIVSVNLEYQDAKYNNTSVDSIGPFAVGTLDDVNASDKSYIVSVTFPIAL
ncbi:MAG: hypothetical protein A2622_12550 [Bdellovibrionales bacterium RIFCSPHIGHO2_01_FULL_40_29]|nr:MAG: hypothetical protein A2622_12550 [Bdellovibrionales bacterium RIFCSPHIGHO2_01_FULL_40_29]OFZ33011.1 MAG: hypothetical protein A3D17_09855 [Bdellovibrionales bacterium RIFCSPHIGHO2_02_FULL_40_15]